MQLKSAAQNEPRGACGSSAPPQNATLGALVSTTLTIRDDDYPLYLLPVVRSRG